ncbi:MAG: fasciclin domain-containing protein [Flavobacterium sp.]|nr:fasciclin domain-containing protein [Flavobacterium sp.]
MKKLIRKMSIACIALTMLACSKDDNTTTLPTITDIAVDNPDFSILVQALTRTNLAGTLDDNSKQFTVFAPTNAAFNTFFSSLGAGVNVNNVDENVLKAILLNHVLGEEIKSSALPAATYASTLSPFNTSANAPTISMFVQKSGSVVTINGGSANGGATVTSADLDASNGVIHVVSNVIAIPTIKNHAVANPNFSTLTSLLVDQDLAATLDGTAGSPFTVFAPLNTAFDTATLNLYTGLSSENKTAVLLYHVVGGVNVRSNAIPAGNITTLQGQSFSITGTVIDDASGVNKNIVLTDVQCSNGVVHAIDKVLLPNL